MTAVGPAPAPAARQDAAYYLDATRVPAATFYAAACDPARPAVVEACAGAGKTWMLVSRILRALLDGAQPQEILAITFTRKAAGEMRARLQEWLSGYSLPCASHDERVLALRLRGVPAEQCERLAPELATLHERLLESGRRVQIRTFHGWFSQLLEAAPMEVLAELGLRAGVERVEDVDDLRADLFRRFHEAVSRDAALRDDYATLVREQGRTNTRKWLEAAWARRAEIELADAAGVLETSVETAGQMWPGFAGLADPAQRLRATGVQALLGRVAAALGAQAKVTPRKQGALLESALHEPDARSALAAARRALLTDDGAPRARLEAAELEAAIRVLDEIDRAARQQDACTAHARMTRLARVLLAEYAALKRSRGLADMDDLERVGLALLRDATLSGWIQERLDARVCHLLIDEFQDTSPLQWHALHAWLSAYAGAGGGASGVRPPSVFIVGDPKQSIYRFRRAEPRVFAAARNFVTGVLGGTMLECDHTRRNAPRVLAAVNSVFGAAIADGAYDGFRRHTTDVSDAQDGLWQQPCVFALPPIAREPQTARARETAPASWRDSLSTPRDRAREVLRQREARQVALAVQAMLEAQVVPTEIMVLARSRASLRRLALELQALHIPYGSPEDLSLLEQPVVRDLVALLDLLACPGHDLSLAHALKSPLFGASDDDLMWLCERARARRFAWWDALIGEREAVPATLGRAATLLLGWRQAAARMPPHDLLDRVVHEGDLRRRVAATLPAQTRQAALAAIDALLAQALTLDAGRYATVYNFVRALRKRNLRTPGAVPPQAVRLLTIHGAKGLEADVVFVMDCEPESRNPDRSSVLVDWPVQYEHPRRCAFVASESHGPASLEELLASERREREREEMNALYVAMTRARCRLVFSHTQALRPAPAAWSSRVAAHVPVVTVGPCRTPGHGLGDDVGTLVELPTRGLRGATPVFESHLLAPAESPSSEGTDAARLGRAVHRILEWAGAWPVRTSPPDLATLVSGAAREFGLDETASTSAASIATTILASDSCRQFFDTARIRWAGNEVSFGDAGEVLRVDRLVALGDAAHDRWWLLDYKLHTQPHALAPYRDQLRRYRDCVRQALPEGAVLHCGFITAAGDLIEPDLGP